MKHFCRYLVAGGEGLISKMVILGSGLLSQTRLRGWLGEGGSLSQVGSTGGASARLLCCSALHDAMAPPAAHLLTSKPPAHTYAHPLICPQCLVELQNSEKASLAGKLTSLLTLALATLGRLLLVALPSLARSSLPAGHRATETLAPAPACGGGCTQPPFHKCSIFANVLKSGDCNVRENQRI